MDISEIHHCFDPCFEPSKTMIDCLSPLVVKLERGCFSSCVVAIVGHSTQNPLRF